VDKKENQEISLVHNQSSNDQNQNSADTTETKSGKEGKIEIQTNWKVFGPDHQGNLLF